MSEVPNFDTIISLDRVRVLERDPETVRVSYAGEIVDITPATETTYEPRASGVQRLSLSLSQQLTLGDVCVDTRVPLKFLEVMIFHELREREYAEAGFTDAHARATNDEVLYVMKFLGPDELSAYATFARKYREGVFDMKAQEGRCDGPRFVHQFSDAKLPARGNTLLCVENVLPGRDALGSLIANSTPYVWIGALPMRHFGMTGIRGAEPLSHWSHLYAVKPVEEGIYREALVFLEDDSSVDLKFPPFVTAVNMRDLSNRAVCDYVSWYDHNIKGHAPSVRPARIRADNAAHVL